MRTQNKNMIADLYQIALGNKQILGSEWEILNEEQIREDTARTRCKMLLKHVERFHQKSYCAFH